jgi:predicted permease
MPSLLIYKLSTASIDANNSVKYVLTALITIAIIFILLIIINKFTPFKASSFTSITQGGIRFNTYVFLALIDSIYDDTGLVLAVLLITFVIPFINILCISVFALYVNEKKLTFTYLLKSIFTNPLIIACLLGGSINFIGIELPIVLSKTIEILASAALPLGLLSVGFGLVLKEISSSKSALVVSNIAKLILTPLIMFFIAKLFGLDEQMIGILIIFAVLPTAPSSFVLARQLGGDISLMSSIITVQTLLSIFFIILVLKYFI